VSSRPREKKTQSRGEGVPITPMMIPIMVFESLSVAETPTSHEPPLSASTIERERGGTPGTISSERSVMRSLTCCLGGHGVRVNDNASVPEEKKSGKVEKQQERDFCKVVDPHSHSGEGLRVVPGGHAGQKRVKDVRRVVGDGKRTCSFEGISWECDFNSKDNMKYIN
jgi:hypothetical protein